MSLKVLNKEVGKDNSKFKISLLTFISIILFLLYTMRDIRGTSSLIITTALFLIMLLLMLLTNYNKIFKIISSKKYVVFFVFLIITSLIYIFSMPIFSTIAYLRTTIILFSVFFIGDYLIALKNIKITKISFYLLVIFLASLSINLYVKLQQDPLLARNLAAGVVSEDLGRMSVGGGYSLVYAITIFIPFLLTLILNKAFLKKSELFIVISSLIIFILTIIKADYGMAFIFTFVGILLVLILHFKNKIIIFILLTILPMLYLFKEIIFGKLINFFISFSSYDSVIYYRLIEVQDFVMNNELSRNSEVRLYLYSLSFKSFKENFIVGKFNFINNNELSTGNFVGGHSEWLDLLAEFGIICFLPLLLFFFKHFFEQIKIFKNKLKSNEIYVPCIVFLVLGSINIVNHFNIYLIIGLMIPLGLQLIKSKDSPLKKGGGK